MTSQPLGPLTVRSPIIAAKPRAPDDEKRVRQQRYLRKVAYSHERNPLPPLVDSSHFRPTLKDCMYLIDTLHGGDLRKLRGDPKLLAELDIWISYFHRHTKRSLLKELAGLSRDMQIVMCTLRTRIRGRRLTRSRPRMSLKKLGKPRYGDAKRAVAERGGEGGHGDLIMNEK